MNWQNLYEDREGEWLKGNLHAHTSPESGCAIIPAEELLDRYVELGHDFLGISNHMTYTQIEDPRIALLPGIEWNSETGLYHTGIHTTDISVLKKAITFKEQDPLLEELAKTDALMIMNHPNAQLVPHYRREELESKQHYQGIEMYNASKERSAGIPLSTDKWDYLLCKGRKILGFANDDSHCYEHIGRGYNVVRCKSRQPGDILNALKSGNFYTSIGLAIEDIRREGNIIEIETKDAEEIWAIADGGVRVERTMDNSIRFDVTDCTCKYVRFDLYGRGSLMAWTQPFFLKD